jgi:predicted component of type VI protein secretion system
MATLRVVSTLAPELEGRSYALGPEGTSLGRDGGNRVVLPEGSVSRRHARIEVIGNHYELVDQRSSNGTFVNDQRVSIHRLVDGDRVRIGHTVLVFEAGGGTVGATHPTPAPMGPPQRCAACGADAPPRSRFCPSCGQPLPQPAVASAHPTPRPGSRSPTTPELEVPPGSLPPMARKSGPAPPTTPPEPPPTGPVEVIPAPGPPPPLPPPPQAPAQVQAPVASEAAVVPPHQAAPDPAPRRTTGCVVGCVLLALLSLLVAASGGLYWLHREGRVTLPGVPRIEAPG